MYSIYIVISIFLYQYYIYLISIGKFGHANSILLKVQIFQKTQPNRKHTNLFSTE